MIRVCHQRLCQLGLRKSAPKRHLDRVRRFCRELGTSMWPPTHR